MCILKKMVCVDKCYIQYIILNILSSVKPYSPETVSSPLSKTRRLYITCRDYFSPSMFCQGYSSACVMSLIKSKGRLPSSPRVISTDLYTVISGGQSSADICSSHKDTQIHMHAHTNPNQVYPAATGETLHCTD